MAGTGSTVDWLGHADFAKASFPFAAPLDVVIVGISPSQRDSSEPGLTTFLPADLDGELCGVDDAGLPSFANTQGATDGEREVRLIYYAFDLLHLDGQDVSGLPLIERKALLEPLIADKPGLQFKWT